MKITINNCHECPCYYQIKHEDLLDENICNHPNGFVFNNDSETPNFTPFRCPLREDPELTIEVRGLNENYHK
jgi:hypothetical protein